MKNIGISILLSILIIVSGVVFIKNKTSKNYVQRKDYIVVKPQGDVDYKFPMTFSKNILSYQAASNFSLSFSNIYIENKKKWVKVPYDYKITKDQAIKITK